MKKKVCIIIIIILGFIGITKNSMAVHITMNIPLTLIYETGLYNDPETNKLYKSIVTTTGEGVFKKTDKKKKYIDEEYVLEQLKELYGYNGKYLTKMAIKTKVTIDKVDLFGKYKVKVGNKECDSLFFTNTIVGNLTEKDLKNTLGYLGDKTPKKGDNWDITIIAKSQENLDKKYDATVVSTGNIDVSLVIGTEIYSGEEVKEESINDAKEVSLNTANIEADNVADVIKNSIENLLSELFGKLFMFLLDFFRAIPDALQMGINTFAKIDTIEAKNVNAEPEAITVPVETIQADSKKNERAQFTTGDENKGNPDKQIIYEVDGKDANFTEETEIPTIPLDMYNIVYGKIDFLDVNFFNVDTSKHQEGTKWMFLRKVFSGALHIMIYLSTAFLIVVLIINGIMIVKGTIIPEKKKEQIDGLKRFVLALIMLVGSVIIMNLCIYGINFFTSFFGDETGGDAFIRVNVAGDTNYSFSANLTEFARFMTQINTVKKLNEKLMYIAIYAFLVFANIVTLLIMLVRSAMIIILSAQGPIVATAYSIDKKVFNMSYSDWIKKYLKWTSIQFILMLGYKLIITLGNL